MRPPRQHVEHLESGRVDVIPPRHPMYPEELPGKSEVNPRNTSHAEILTASPDT